MKAPDFQLPDQSNKIHQLSDFAGKWLVIYFYPKDDTPGCTKEACNFRDSWHTLEGMGVALVGVSKDNVKSHKKFADKYQLKFPLLSDSEHTMIEAYGAWSEKKFMGKTFEGIQRNTLLINPQGEIVKEYTSVNPLTHSGEIIKDLEQLQA